MPRGVGQLVEKNAIIPGRIVELLAQGQGHLVLCRRVVSRVPSHVVQPNAGARQVGSGDALRLGVGIRASAPRVALRVLRRHPFALVDVKHVVVA